MLGGERIDELADELGNAELDGRGPELSVQILTERKARCSAIVPSRLSCSRWGQVIGGPGLVAAIVDASQALAPRRAPVRVDGQNLAPTAFEVAPELVEHLAHYEGAVTPDAADAPDAAVALSYEPSTTLAGVAEVTHTRSRRRPGSPRPGRD